MRLKSTNSVQISPLFFPFLPRDRGNLKLAPCVRQNSYFPYWGQCGLTDLRHFDLPSAPSALSVRWPCLVRSSLHISAAGLLFLRRRLPCFSLALLHYPPCSAQRACASKRAFAVRASRPLRPWGVHGRACAQARVPPCSVVLVCSSRPAPLLAGPGVGYAPVLRASPRFTWPGRWAGTVAGHPHWRCPQVNCRRPAAYHPVGYG